MTRVPILPLVLAVLLTVPMAVTAVGILDAGDHEHRGQATFSITQDLLAADPTGSFLVGPLYIEHDDNHTSNVWMDVGDDAAEVGRWLGPFDGEVPAVNLAVLPDGRVMYYSGVEARPADQTGNTDLTFMVGDFPEHAKSRVMSVTVGPDGALTHEVTLAGPETGGNHDLFCSGTTITPDGTVLATGGTQWHTLDEQPDEAALTPLKGSEQVMRFSATDDRWTQGSEMGVDRWYPSALQLPDGRTLIASGIQTLAQPQTHNTLLEIYDPVTDTHEAVEPTLEVAPGVTVGQLLPDRPSTGSPSVDETHDRIPNLPMYPRLTTIPSGERAGEVFYSTAGDLWG
ncbi:MAG: hypothetical protein R3185_04650, partial [Candidatus Thermoplasmatota archaeon]|nr:hypothetical protein [Candidatus Thermoplasmatota archaeon]